MSIHLQDALVCKMCPDATVSTILVVMMKAGLLLIGIFLGSRIKPDGDHAAEDPVPVTGGGPQMVRSAANVPTNVY